MTLFQGSEEALQELLCIRKCADDFLGAARANFQNTSLHHCLFRALDCRLLFLQHVFLSECQMFDLISGNSEGVPCDVLNLLVLLSAIRQNLIFDFVSHISYMQLHCVLNLLVLLFW